MLFALPKMSSPLNMPGTLLSLQEGPRSLAHCGCPLNVSVRRLCLVLDVATLSSNASSDFGD